MLKLEISGDTPAELAANLISTAALLSASGTVAGKPDASKGGKAGKATSTAQEPSGDQKTSSSGGKDTKAAVGSTAEVVAADDDGLGEDDDGLGEEPVTREDVKALLIELKNTKSDDPQAVGKLVASVCKSSGARKLADVKDEELAALAAAAKKALGK